VDPTGDARRAVRLAPEARERTTDLARLPINGATGRWHRATVPLGQVASITRAAPGQIDHLDRSA
jgi:hypothetical protein